MAMQSGVRIRKEFKEVQQSSDGSGVSAELVGDDFTHWKGSVQGPEGTPYQGGVFIVDIIIGANYPFEPPKMRFDTKVWHPNVSSQNGAICLDILKTEWSAGLVRERILTQVDGQVTAALLSCPNPDDPQDGQVAGQYKRDKKEFERTAKFWTEMYAQPAKKTDSKEAVKKLTDMGFDEKKSIEALAKCKGDESAAVEWLMSHA